ncbi:MAG: hypothetical protein HOO86_08470 [Bacteroidales bacterium]|nr:hypothetical protein [Bacteroidales bacterium]
MKKRCKLILILAIFGNFIYAQSNDANKLEILTGGSFAKPKIIPSLTNLALAQITINYKLTSTERTVGHEKSTGATSGAKITAYLETTDGELTNADFQEITDYFYSYFQNKLKENGIDTIGWNTIIKTDFYKNAVEKDGEGEDEKQGKSGNVWVTSTAHKGNILYGGATPFAFGKIKKASKFCDEIGAPAGFFHITVDFADIMVHVGIKTEGSGLYYYQTRTTKTEWVVESEMKVVPSTHGNTLFWNKKSQAESLVQRGDLEAVSNYQDAINEDASRLKNWYSFSKLWAFNKELDPIVIETTRAKYKAAAKKALEKYADAFIAKTKDGK